MEVATEAETQVVIERRGGAGIIHLNRPKAINSLTLPMVRAMLQALHRFEDDPDVSCVVLTGEGDRGLCAGGDVRIIHDLGKAGDPQVLDFWREEFPLNYHIARFGKPYVALMDGIVMGGGVGISAHASHRIVTERTKLAMPETGIGYFPDVGATWLLPRTPGESGTWMALTGLDINASDAIYTGLADVYMSSSRLEEAVHRLTNLSAGSSSDDVDAVLRDLSEQVDEGRLQANAAMIDRAFHFNRVEDIASALAAEEGEFAAETRRVMLTRSPTSLKLALRLLRAGRQSRTLGECLARELGACMHVLHGPDFYEGVRAAVIDKDRNPKWSPPTIALVNDEMIGRFFESPKPPLSL